MELKRLNGEIIEVVDWETVVHYMVDDVREEINREIAPCSEQEFFSEYEKKHLEMYGEESFEAFCEFIRYR